ncbi:hypothetical protein EG329_001524 [Mollisiaceae sp. DMI_Dod_QoI]|nr:hypothetical protein EG329_001524 [Helotiales sp. DMI_Dod_QoI]
MSDPLSITASIAGLVSLTITTFNGIVKFTNSAKNARNKAQQLATMTRNLAGTLQNLELLALQLDGSVDGKCSLTTDHLKSCRRTLLKIDKKLKGPLEDFNSRKLKSIARSLKWPFSADETNELVEELSSYQHAVQLALESDTLTKLLQCLSRQTDLHNSLEELKTEIRRKDAIETRIQLNHKQQEIINYFLKVNPQYNFTTCLQFRHSMTGLWLTDTDDTFQQWKALPNSKLWLNGIPGAGKTVLCGAVIDELLQEQSDTTAVAFFFCDYKDAATHDPVNVLSSIATQLAQQNAAAFTLLEQYYGQLQPETPIKRRQLTIKDLVRLVVDISTKYNKVYIIADGLDECGDNVSVVAQSLSKLAQEATSLSIAIFSRRDEDIKVEIGDEYAHIDIAAHTEDLDRYVRSEMSEKRSMKNLFNRNPDFHDEICRTLVEEANGMQALPQYCELFSLLANYLKVPMGCLSN